LRYRSLLLLSTAANVASGLSKARLRQSRNHSNQGVITSDQASLPMTHFGQPLGQPFLVPAKPGPVLQIVDMAFHCVAGQIPKSHGIPIRSTHI